MKSMELGNIGDNELIFLTNCEALSKKEPG
jgi:hypothetical protein